MSGGFSDGSWRNPSHGRSLPPIFLRLSNGSVTGSSTTSATNFRFGILECMYQNTGSQGPEDTFPEDHAYEKIDHGLAQPLFMMGRLR